MLRFFRLLFTKLRLSNPWRYKAPFLISVPYFFLLAGGFDPMEGLQGIGWSLMTILGIAGFGYWANDFSDREEDRKAGKPNALEGMPLWQAFSLLGVLLTAAILPWVVYFPITYVTLSLLAGEFLLFVLYSLPPFRFKERGILGPICDAGYAHANPAILAAITFYTLAPRHWAGVPFFLIAVGMFQFFLGLRNIFLHQLADYDHDMASGAKTLVVKMGVSNAWKWIQWGMLPLELLSLGLYLGVISGMLVELEGAFVLTFAMPAFVLIAIFQLRIVFRQPFPDSLRNWITIFLDEFYVDWLPFFILIALILHNPGFWPVLALHIILFRNGPKRLVPAIYNRWIQPRLRL